MKKICVTIIFLSSILFAQTAAVDSLTNASLKDSLQISEMVKQQIENAKEKRAASINNPENYIKKNAQLQTVITAQPVQQNNMELFLQNLPDHIKIFIAIAVGILFTITMRRTVLKLTHKTRQSLRAKIAMLREERVVSQENPKLTNSRLQLKNNITVLNATEKEISKAAKDLNIAKGELLLAARLNLLEVGKI